MFQNTDASPCSTQNITLHVEDCYTSLDNKDIFQFLQYVNTWMSSCIQEHSTQNEVNITDSSEADDVYKKRMFVFFNTESIAELLRKLESFNDTYQEYYLRSTNDTSKCFSDIYLKIIKIFHIQLEGMYRELWWVYIFQKYIQICITVVIFSSGLFMTGILLVIFIKHKEMRSEPNIIVLNISICDLLSLLVIYPMQLLVYNGIYPSAILIYLQILLILSCASALSILSLSLQRFFIVTGYLKNSCFCRMKKRLKILLFFIFVWSPVILFELILYILYDVLGRSMGPKIASISMICFILLAALFLFVLPIMVTAVGCATSYRLRRSAREIPGDQSKENQARGRFRSARVINCLCLVYWISHFPISLEVLHFFFEFRFTSDLKMKYFIWTVNSLFCLNALFNPLAQIIISRQFRSLYMHYLSKCMCRGRSITQERL